MPERRTASAGPQGIRPGDRFNSETDWNTLLTGYVPDQAALHGILMKIRDLGLILIALARLEEQNGNGQ